MKKAARWATGGRDTRPAEPPGPRPSPSPFLSHRVAQPL